MNNDFVEVIDLFKNFAALVIRRFQFLDWLLVHHRHRRSIIRTIGSALPLKPVNRVYINTNAFLPCTDEIKNDSSINRISAEWSCSVGGNLLCSTPKKYDSKLEELETELKKLREQVSQILSCQIKNISGENGLHTVSVALQYSGERSLASPPLRPPPPPPPLPPLSFLVQPPVPHSNVKKIRKLRSPKVQKNALNDVLKELMQSRPKLRHVKVSPGGRPVRSPKDSSDPAHILAKVLKQRFNSINCMLDSNDRDSSDSLLESDFSFENLGGISVFLKFITLILFNFKN